MRKRRKSSEESIKGTWLNTYADLVTLLLCFFVLLFSMSVIDNIKFKQMIMSFGSTAGLNLLKESSDTISISPIETNKANEKKEERNPKLEEERKFQRIQRELSEFVSLNNLSDSVEVYSEKEGVLIRFNDTVLFDKGSAVLKENALQILMDMAGLLCRYDRMVRVEGHTDSDPIRNNLYPSNWELSTARAVNVVKFFIEGVPEEVRIKPTLLQALGYGEYLPMVENTTEENKAKNRRIEIVILKKF